MDFCNIEKIKVCTKKYKYTVVGCLFRPYSRNRKGILYSKGTMYTQKFLKKYSDWKLRIYFDSSLISDSLNQPFHIKEKKNIWIPLLAYLRTCDNVELFYYRCDNFLDKDRIHHKEYFGSLTRIFPVFDPSEQSGMIFCGRDMDNKMGKSDIKYVEKWANSDKKGLFYVYFSDNANVLDKFNEFGKFDKSKSPLDITNRRLLFGGFSLKQLPKDLLNNFLKTNKTWDYGVDEYFLNSWVKSYLYQRNDYSMVLVLDNYGFYLSKIFRKSYSKKAIPFILENMDKCEKGSKIKFLDRVFGLNSHSTTDSDRNGLFEKLLEIIKNDKNKKIIKNVMNGLKIISKDKCVKYFNNYFYDFMKIKVDIDNKKINLSKYNITDISNFNDFKSFHRVNM
jgi:hypothetical protein